MAELEYSLSVEKIIKATGGHLIRGDPYEEVTGISTDSRTLRPGELFIPLKGENFDGHLFIQEAIIKGARATLTERPPDSLGCHLGDVSWIKVEDTLLALGSIAKYWRECHPIPVIAITGTNGKTTTKEMTASILSQKYKVIKTEGNLNNRIGLPLTILRMRGDDQVAIVEMGMSLEGEIKALCEIARPNTGLITNIGNAHLDHLIDIEGVKRAKGELLESLGRNDTALINMDDQRCMELAERCQAKKIFFGLHRKADVRGEDLEPFNLEGARFELIAFSERISVLIHWHGRQAIMNALASASAGISMGLCLEDIKKGLEAFRPFPMRLNLIELKGNVWLLDDTYNANPQSMEIALESLVSIKGKGKAIAVLGDMKELGRESSRSHFSLGQRVASYAIDTLFLIGDFSEDVAKGAISAGMRRDSIFIARSHEEIVSNCLDEAKGGAWILVKGSRAMAMENVVHHIVEAIGIKEKEENIDRSKGMARCSTI
jgi:UDP-N-acetylmuramoyl-tripeptide--D-alanyl-D-alanine ligase